MAILGRNTSSGFGDIQLNGVRCVSKVTLATPNRLDELYVNVQNQVGVSSMRIVFYDDDGGSGEPGTLLAMTPDISVPNSSFTTRGGAVITPINLASGNYWIGAHLGGTLVFDLDTAAIARRVFTGTDTFSDGPANPWTGSRNTTDIGSYQAWGIVGATLNAAGTATNMRFGTGLTVIDQGGGTIRVDASGNTPPDATSSVKGLVQLAGDLSGTAASPQIATGVVVAGDLASSLKPSGTAATSTEALRALGTTAGTAAAGDDSRFTSLYDIALSGDGLKAETISRLTLSGVVSPTSQSILLVRAPIRAGTLINNILCALTTLGVGTAPTLIKMALLDKTGKVLEQSANLAGNAMWTAGLGIKTVALGSQVTIPSSDVYYLSFLKNGAFASTDMQLLRVAWPTAAMGAAIGSVPLSTTVTTQTDYPANGSSVIPGAGGTTSAFWFGAN